MSAYHYCGVASSNGYMISLLIFLSFLCLLSGVSTRLRQWAYSKFTDIKQTL